MGIVGVVSGLNEDSRSGEAENGNFGGLDEKGKEIGTDVIWFDAHANFETPETLTSGYLDGKTASMLIGECWGALLGTVSGYQRRRKDAVFVGTRDLSAAKSRKLETEKVKVVYGGREERDDQYAGELMRHLETGAAREECVIHIDLDCLDISLGKANEFASPAGLYEQDLLGCLKVVLDHRTPVALSVVRLNPSCERADGIAEVAVESIVKVIELMVKDRWCSRLQGGG